jgi:hypothetical protein
VKACLVDTGILYALFDRSDRWHERAVDFANAYPGRLAVAACAIPEATYLINKHLGIDAEAELLSALARRDFDVEDLELHDYARAVQFLVAHRRLNIGFVDAATVALSERLKIDDVATTDRRHFSAIKPSHRPLLNLLP